MPRSCRKTELVPLCLYSVELLISSAVDISTCIEQHRCRAVNLTIYRPFNRTAALLTVSRILYSMKYIGLNSRVATLKLVGFSVCPDECPVLQLVGNFSFGQCDLLPLFHRKWKDQTLVFGAVGTL